MQNIDRNIQHNKNNDLEYMRKPNKVSGGNVYNILCLFITVTNVQFIQILSSACFAKGCQSCEPLKYVKMLKRAVWQVVYNSKWFVFMHLAWHATNCNDIHFHKNSCHKKIFMLNKLGKKSTNLIENARIVKKTIDFSWAKHWPRNCKTLFQ